MIYEIINFNSLNQIIQSINLKRQMVFSTTKIDLFWGIVRNLNFKVNDFANNMFL